MSLFHLAAAVDTNRRLFIRLHITIGAVTGVTMMVLMLVASLGPFSNYACFPVQMILDGHMQGIGTKIGTVEFVFGKSF